MPSLLEGGLPTEPVAGVRGANLSRTDPVMGEWDVVVLAPHFAAGMLARELDAEDGVVGMSDLERTIEFALTYDRHVVVSAAHSLMSRVCARPRAGST